MLLQPKVYTCHVEHVNLFGTNQKKIDPNFIEKELPDIRE